MKNNKPIKIIVIYAIIIAIIFLGWYLYQKNNTPVIDNSVIPSIQVLGNQSDLVSFSVDPGEKVSGVLTVAGSVKGGYFFEGNILLNILDVNKEVIREGNGNAKTDWMTTEPVGFDGVLDFTKLPKGPAYIEIQNDDPSDGEGGPAKKILIPIIIE